MATYQHKRQHDSIMGDPAGAWRLFQLPDELLARVLAQLPPNDIACNVRFVCKEASAQLTRPQHTTVSVGDKPVRSRSVDEPELVVPAHALLGRWGHPGAGSGLTYTRRQQLLCQAARTGSIPALDQLSRSLGCLISQFVLYAAASAGQLDLCRWLLQQHPDPPHLIGHVSFDSSILVREAVRSGKIELVSALLDMGCTLYCRHLYCAIERGNRAMCEWLASHGCPWTAHDDPRDAFSALTFRLRPYEHLPPAAAAHKGDLPLLAWALSRGKDDGSVHVPHGMQGMMLADVAHGCPLSTLQQLYQQLTPAVRFLNGNVDARVVHAMLVGAACSPTPDWRDKALWLLSRQEPQVLHLAPDLARGLAACKEDGVVRTEWLREQKLLVPWADVRWELALFAAARGNLPVLDFLMDQGVLGAGGDAQGDESEEWEEGAWVGEEEAEEWEEDGEGPWGWGQEDEGEDEEEEGEEEEEEGEDEEGQEGIERVDKEGDEEGQQQEGGCDGGEAAAEEAGGSAGAGGEAGAEQAVAGGDGRHTSVCDGDGDGGQATVAAAARAPGGQARQMAAEEEAEEGGGEEDKEEQQQQQQQQPADPEEAGEGGGKEEKEKQQQPADPEEAEEEDGEGEKEKQQQPAGLGEAEEGGGEEEKEQQQPADPEEAEEGGGEEEKEKQQQPADPEEAEAEEDAEAGKAGDEEASESEGGAPDEWELSVPGLVLAAMDGGHLHVLKALHARGVSMAGCSMVRAVGQEELPMVQWLMEVQGRLPAGTGAGGEQGRLPGGGEEQGRLPGGGGGPGLGGEQAEGPAEGALGGGEQEAQQQECQGRLPGVSGGPGRGGGCDQGRLPAGQQQESQGGLPASELRGQQQGQAVGAAEGATKGAEQQQEELPELDTQQRQEEQQRQQEELHRRRRRLTGAVMDAASHSKNEGLVRWLRGVGCPWSGDALTGLAEWGSEQLLQWAVEQEGCPVPDDGEPYFGAAMNGDLALLWCLRRLGCPWGPDPTALMIRMASSISSRVPVLQWFADQGLPARWGAVQTWLRVNAKEKARPDVVMWVGEMAGGLP